MASPFIPSCSSPLLLITRLKEEKWVAGCIFGLGKGYAKARLCLHARARWDPVTTDVPCFGTRLKQLSLSFPSNLTSRWGSKFASCFPEIETPACHSPAPHLFQGLHCSLPNRLKVPTERARMHVIFYLWGNWGTIQAALQWQGRLTGLHQSTQSWGKLTPFPLQRPWPRLFFTNPIETYRKGETCSLQAGEASHNHVTQTYCNILLQTNWTTMLNAQQNVPTDSKLRTHKSSVALQIDPHTWKGGCALHIHRSTWISSVAHSLPNSRLLAPCPSHCKVNWSHGQTLMEQFNAPRIWIIPSDSFKPPLLTTGWD